MTRERLWSQVVAAVVMSQTHWIYGAGICFAGQLIAEAQSADPAVSLSVAESTLVASLMNLGRMMGCVVSAQLTDRLGVLRVIQLGTPLSLLAWPLLTLTTDSRPMSAGAMLMGAFVGLNAFGGRLYIAEVTSTRNRAVLSYFPTIALGLSLLASFSLSAALPWRQAILLCACAPSAVHFLGAVLLPNSPRWLIHRGDEEIRARKSIVFFRGQHTDVAMELKDIRQSLKGRPALNILHQARLIVTDWDVAKPCLLLLAQYSFEVLCGGIVLTQYAPGIFQLAVRSLTPLQCSQLLAALQVTALVGSASLLRWWGRRSVLMAAGLLTAGGMLTVAAHFHYQTSLGGHTWLVVAGLLLANAGSSGGVSPLTHLFGGELLPLAVRQSFGNVLSLYLGGLAMAFIYLFAEMQRRLGLAGLFATLAAVNVLQALFARCLLPETRGLSLEEVQRRYFCGDDKGSPAGGGGGRGMCDPCGAGSAVDGQGGGVTDTRLAAGQPAVQEVAEGAAGDGALAGNKTLDALTMVRSEVEHRDATATSTGGHSDFDSSV